jgi:hypothetical protein
VCLCACGAPLKVAMCDGGWRARVCQAGQLVKMIHEIVAAMCALHLSRGVTVHERMLHETCALVLVQRP